MAIGGNFFLPWRSYSSVISTSVFYLILVAAEHIMDSDFKCPEGMVLIIIYSLFYILIPPIILIPLGCIFQPVCLHLRSEDEEGKWNKCNTCKVKAFIPAVLWIIIMCLDGKYLDCPFELFLENAYQIFQMLGLGLLFLIVIIVFYWYRKTPTKRIIMNADQSKTMLKENAEEYLKNQQKETIQKLIEKYLKDHYLVPPEAFLAALTYKQISEQIEEGFKVVCEIQAPAAGNENSNGGNSTGNSRTQTENAQDSGQMEMDPMLAPEVSGASL